MNFLFILILNFPLLRIQSGTKARHNNWNYTALIFCYFQLYIVKHSGRAQRELYIGNKSLRFQWFAINFSVLVLYCWRAHCNEILRVEKYWLALECARAIVGVGSTAQNAPFAVECLHSFYINDSNDTLKGEAVTRDAVYVCNQLLVFESGDSFFALNTVQHVLLTERPFCAATPHRAINLLDK